MSVIPATVRVPTINERQRVPQAAIAEVVRHIVELYRPERLILFGSYAYGDPRPESDVDLLVVMDTELRESEQAVQILQSIEHHFGIDLIVRTPESLEHRLALGDSFLTEIVERGEVLYERSLA